MPNVQTATGYGGASLPIFELGAVQNVSYNAAGGASTASSAFGAATTAVLISTTTSDVRIAIGSAPTASSSTTLIPKPAMVVLWVGAGGNKVAVLGNDATTGSICITELGVGPQ